MADISSSFLPEIAVVEREELEEVEKTAARCREQVDELRKSCRREIAAIPEQLQEERRLLIAQVQEEDAQKADDLAKHAAREVARLGSVVETLSDEINAMLLDAIMPHAICGHARKGAS